MKMAGEDLPRLRDVWCSMFAPLAAGQLCSWVLVCVMIINLDQLDENFNHKKNNFVWSTIKTHFKDC